MPSSRRAILAACLLGPLATFISGGTAAAQDYLRQAMELDASFRKRAKADPDLKGIA